MGRKEIVGGTLAAALAVAVFEGSVLVRSAGAAEPVPVRAGEQAAAAAGAPVAVGERTVASAVPEGAILFVSAAAREKWKRSFDDSNLGAAYREDEVRQFLSPAFDKAKALIQGRKKQVEENLHGVVNFAEIERALVGEVGLAVLDVKAKPEGGGEDPVLLLVAEVGENAQAFETGMDEFIKRVQAALAGAGAPAGGDLRARTYRGADLRTFTVDKTTIAYARTKGYFLFGFDPASVEKGIDCLEGAAPSLAASPLLRKSENGLLAASANLAEFIRRERAKPGWEANQPDDHQVEVRRKGPDWKELDALGFTTATRLSYRLDFDKPLFREKLSVEIFEARGLLSLLKDAKPVDAQKLAADAPADALIFTAVNLPADKIVETVFKMLDAADPRVADEGRKNLLKMKEQGLDVEALLGKSLTGEATLWASMPPAGAGMFPEVVLVLGAKDNAAVEGTIQMLAREAAKGVARQRIAAELRAGGGDVDWAKVNEQAAKEAGAFKLEAVEYKGGRLFALPMEKGNPIQVTAILMPDKVIIASSAVAAKRAAGKPAGGALADKAEFKDALAALSSGAVAVQYIDVPRAFGMAYGTAVPFLAAWGSADRFKQRWGLDLKQLPPAELISRHLSPEAGAFYADEKGLRLEARTNLPRAVLAAGMAGFAAQHKGGGRRGPVAQPMPVPVPEREEF